MTYGFSKNKNETLKSGVVAPAYNPQHLDWGKKIESLMLIWVI